MPKIDKIIEFPNYVGINPLDNSIEYVKEFKQYGEFAKVSVRASGSGINFVRTMFSLPIRKVNKFIKIKRFKKLD